MKENKANKTLLSVLRIIKRKCSGYPFLLIAIQLKVQAFEEKQQ